MRNRVNRAGAHKERNLTPSMHDNLKPTAKDTHAHGKHSAERYIRELRDSGIGQTRFEIILTQRNH